MSQSKKSQMGRAGSPASDASDVVAGRAAIQEYREALEQLEKKKAAEVVPDDDEPRSPVSTPPPPSPPRHEPEAPLSVPPKATPKKLVQQQLQWSGTEQINAQWFSAVGRDVVLDRLGFDLKVEYGQSRSLDMAHVDRIIDSLRLRPPREPLKLTVWQNDADSKLYVMSGQHLAKALVRMREQRMQQGLKMEHWLEVARVDILKFNTPIAVRKQVSGADNASTRVQRDTLVSECLRNYMADTVGGEVHDRIRRSIENSGLNVDTESPVSFVFYCACSLFVLCTVHYNSSVGTGLCHGGLLGSCSD